MATVGIHETRTVEVTGGGIAAVVAGWALRGPMIGAIAAGALLIVVAFRLGFVWTARLRDETDPGRQLMLNLLLALAVLLALVGVGLMSAPLV